MLRFLFMGGVAIPLAVEVGRLTLLQVIAMWQVRLLIRMASAPGPVLLSGDPLCLVWCPLMLLRKLRPVPLSPQVLHRVGRTVHLKSLLLLLFNLYPPLPTSPWHPLKVLGQPLRGPLAKNPCFLCLVPLTSLGVNLFGNPLVPFSSTL